jgi:quercetin dioxygenase-like cupin family protein
MCRFITLSVSALLAVIALCLTGERFVNAEQQLIKRTELLKTDLAGTEGKEMHIWTADIAPAAATGRHHHPTPRFVIVLEGSVILEVDGKPAQTFKAGQAFQELPDVVHNFKNASTTEPAKAIGIQYAAKGQPLQVDAH